MYLTISCLGGKNRTSLFVFVDQQQQSRMKGKKQRESKLLEIKFENHFYRSKSFRLFKIFMFEEIALD